MNTILKKSFCAVLVVSSSVIYPLDKQLEQQQVTTINYAKLEAASTGLLGLVLGGITVGLLDGIIEKPSPSMVATVFSLMGLSALAAGSVTLLYLCKKMFSEPAISIDSEKIIYNNKTIFWEDVKNICIERRISYSYHSYSQPVNNTCSYGSFHHHGYISEHKYYIIVFEMLNGTSYELNPNNLDLNISATYWLIDYYFSRSKLII